MPNKSLHTMPIEDITFEMIEEFCELELVEGIDLDYKSDWPNDLSKLICAFANTQGGLILIAALTGTRIIRRIQDTVRSDQVGGAAGFESTEMAHTAIILQVKKTGGRRPE